MSSTFRAVSISYANAPAEIRQRLSFDEIATRKLIQHLSKQAGLDNILVLSASRCIEVYYTATTDRSFTVVEALYKQKQTTYAENINLLPEDTYTVIHAPGKAVQHMFQLATGARKMRANEDDFYKLLKKAYDISLQEKVAGAYLRRIMQTILLFRSIRWN